MNSTNAPVSKDTDLGDLLNDINKGKIQLPEFQRNWTWDDDRICGIIASIMQFYPMGAIMSLQYGNESCRFKYRTIEGVSVKDVIPDTLILDGQQRLTSLYRAAYSRDPVETKDSKDKPISRFYYLDINKCLDENEDLLDAVVSIPVDKKNKTNFDRTVVLDLSSRELEYENDMFPLNIVFSSDREDWMNGYYKFHKYDESYIDKFTKFRLQILNVICGYKVPVITLSRETPREAVCKVFENVNTGGISLTVFELVTATFAAEEFDLRDDWEKCKKKIHGEEDSLNTDVMTSVDETAFLTSITLLSTYRSDKMTTCKKKDVLNLSLAEYKANENDILVGYSRAKSFLLSQCVYRKRDLPYATQLIPLSAICAALDQTEFNRPQTKKILSSWFWCGILGEMYGGANETRYANDIEDVIDEIRGKDSKKRTVNAAFFSSTRLLSLRTRGSAAYKGIMALLYKANCLDFMLGTPMTTVVCMTQSPDIHHIFPEAYCIEKGYNQDKWNTIVNKTPLLPASNQQIGGVAPSVYSKKIMREAGIGEDELKRRIESNLVDYDLFISDDFDGYFIDRAKRILNLIETAMEKRVSDRGSEETINRFGASLL